MAGANVRRGKLLPIVFRGRDARFRLLYREKGYLMLPVPAFHAFFCSRPRDSFVIYGQATDDDALHAKQERILRM